jgi:iron complex outermembrane receptor protein
MNKLTLLTGSSALALSLVSGAAFAQQATTPQTVVAQNTPEQQTAAEAAETVVVSASRISIAGDTAPTPVSVVDSGQLQQAANNDIGETLRQLPMMGTAQSPVAATQGNAGNSGAVGISSINLRNLGVTRTLVLVDGDREVWAGVQYGVDLNTIPSIMIKRVDVVTGGASAAWGSDAVAGVVNLIIDKNFTGLKGSVDLMDNNYDSRRQYGFSIANGFDFDSDRGHIELAGTYADSPNTTYMGQLKWFNNPALVANPAYNATTNPGVPQLIHVNNAGNSSPPGGYISATTLTSGVASTALNNIQFGPNSQISPYSKGNCSYYANSNLPPYIAATTSTTNTTCSGGSDGQAYSPSQIGLASYPLLTETGFFYGTYKVTPNIVASAMLNYSKVSAVGSSLTIQTNAVVNSGNPYIPASVQSQMTALGVKSITVTSTGTSSTGGQPGGFIQAAPGVGPEQFENSVGTPEEYTNRQFYRGVFKLDGTIGNDWSWDVSAQHSENHLHEHYNSIEIVSNFTNAVNAVTVTAANQGTSGIPIGSIACASTLTSPTNGCVPYNPFGTGVVNPASLGYIVDHNDYYFLNMEEDTGHAGMQGVLPWDFTGAGAPALSFGWDWRKETMVSKADPFGSLGALGGGNFVPISAEYNTEEGYGELDIPIIKNGFVESLDGNMAGRITDYSTSGMVETWKLGLTSQINDDFRVRGTWSFDIRAPDLAELFNDIPASGGQVDYKNNITEAVALSEAHGNANLFPETATTISAGVVLTPHWVPGLTMSFDVYSINVKNIVVTPSATFEKNACQAGTPTPNGTASVQGTGGPGTNTGQTGYCADWTYNPSLVNSSNVNGLQFLYTYPFNNGYLKTSGIDFNADYQMDFLEGNLAWHLAGNYTDEETETEFGVTAAGGGQAKYDFAGALSGAALFAGVPKMHAILSTTYTQGPWSGTVQARYLGEAVLANGWTSGVQVDNNSVPAVGYLDLRASYNWNAALTFYAAVDNTLNTPPPNIASYSVSNNGLSTVNPSIYDVLGRMYHAGLRFNY